MTAKVGIVVSLSTYRATVHYVECPWYRQSSQRRLALPRTIRFRICQHCQPTATDIKAAPPEASWYAWSPHPEARLKQRVSMRVAEEELARQQTGNGKRYLGWTS